MNVLLCINSVPDSLEFFFLKDLSKEELEVLNKAKGCYINDNDDESKEEATNKIFTACSPLDQRQQYVDNVPQDWLEKDWHSSKLVVGEKAPLMEGTFRLVEIGFVL